jgi:SAM-dependent methyltransferase
MQQPVWNHQGFMDLSRNFWILCSLKAGVELGLFTALDTNGDGKISIDSLAAKINADSRATGMMVTALASLGLLVRDGQYVGLTEVSRRLLSANSKEYYGHMILHQSHIMPNWIRLAESVKSGQRVASSTAAESGNDETREDFLMAMYNGARFQAETVAKALDLGSKKKVLDLGGGPGTYAAHFCLQYQGLSATVFDLPGSAPVARKILSRLGVADRVSFVAGDYNKDPLPKHFDVVFVSQVLHQESPEGAAALIAKAAGSLERGGFLAIQEFFVDDSLNGPIMPALFSLNMLVNTKGGQSYTHSQVNAILRQAGLTDIHLLSAKLPPGCCVMVGTKQ